MKREDLLKGQELLDRIRLLQQILKNLQCYNTTLNKNERGEALMYFFSVLSIEEKESARQDMINTIEGKISVLQDEFDRL